MSNSSQPGDENESKGPNLVLIYTLMAIAFLIAVAFAAAIVLPFYHRK